MGISNSNELSPISSSILTSNNNNINSDNSNNIDNSNTSSSNLTQQQLMSIAFVPSPLAQFAMSMSSPAPHYLPLQLPMFQQQNNINHHNNQNMIPKPHYPIPNG